MYPSKRRLSPEICIHRQIDADPTYRHPAARLVWPVDTASRALACEEVSHGDAR